MPELLPHHLADLQLSGLSDETIAACGFRSESKYERLAEILRWKKWPKRMGSALVIPFRGPDGDNGYCRLKPDTPRWDRNQKPIKYESPKGQSNHVFIPPNTFAVLDDPTAEMLITEGEKKAAKSDQDGYRCIGLVGVFGWKDGKSERLLPDLERISWQGRQVRIVFDNDSAEKPDVRDAESRLAVQLNNLGAIVKVVRLPDGPPGSDGKPTKTGLDDYLVAHGPAALRKLLDAAEDAEPIQGPQERIPAVLLDAYPEAKRWLSAEWTRDGELTLRRYADEWYGWLGWQYVRLPEGDMQAALTRYLSPNVTLINRGVVGNILHCVAAESNVPSRTELPAWLNQNGPWPADEILATKSGLLHLPSLVENRECLLPPSPRFFSVNGLDYYFDPAATCEDWLRFLGELWPNDSESVATLQEWFGYCLLPDTRQQKILLLVGPKRSGKGTVARVVRAMVGPDNVAAPTLSGLGTNFGLWPLLGKSVAIVSDARLSGRSDLAQVTERLLSVSGEDAQTIDRKCMVPVTTRLKARFVILTNELPRLDDASGALASRMILLRLTRSWYGNEDTGLTDRLLGELPGILLWAIAGWDRLRKRGHFIQPESSRELIDDLERLTSPVAAFVADYCRVGEGAQSQVADVFAAWCAWCREHGRQRPGTEQVLGRDLRATIPTLRVTNLRDGDQRHRFYEGLVLKADGLNAAESWRKDQRH